MNQNEGYRSGDWSAYCDICGGEFYASELQLNWKGLRVCKQDFEYRNPQDFIRPVVEKISTPWSRSVDGTEFATIVTLYTAQPVEVYTMDNLTRYVDTTAGNVVWVLPDPTSATYYSQQVVYTLINNSGSNNITVTAPVGWTLTGSGTIGSTSTGKFTNTNGRAWVRVM